MPDTKWHPNWNKIAVITTTLHSPTLWANNTKTSGPQVKVFRNKFYHLNEPPSKWFKVFLFQAHNQMNFVHIEHSTR